MISILPCCEGGSQPKKAWNSPRRGKDRGLLLTQHVTVIRFRIAARPQIGSVIGDNQNKSVEMPTAPVHPGQENHGADQSSQQEGFHHAVKATLFKPFERRQGKKRNDDRPDVTSPAAALAKYSLKPSITERLVDIARSTERLEPFCRAIISPALRAVCAEEDSGTLRTTSRNTYLLN